MKAKIILLLCFLSLLLSAQNVNIPDANFKAYLVGNSAINTNGDTEIQVSEAQAFSGMINVYDKSISDVTGIEAFVNLTEFYCVRNQLTSINISANTALTNLSVSLNNLTSLDVSQNIALKKLYFTENQIATIDLTNNTALTHLQCYQNNLTVLDVSQNTALTLLQCYQNNLTVLDVSQNTALTNLHFSNNQISSIDLSANTALTYLVASHNSLTTLDLSNQTLLTFFTAQYNQLTTIDVSKNTLLKSLYLNDNNLTSIDLNSNTELENLSLHKNSLTLLDLHPNTKLKSLACRDNQLTTLNVANGNNGTITGLWAHNNPNLTCIQHDNGFDPTTNSNWVKDATANWSNDCDIPQFTITPISKDFGTVLTGQNATQVFTITNNGTADLSITAFALSGANANEFSHNGTTQTIAPNGTYDITVTFTPTSAGSKVASLDITDNTVLGNHTVALSGTGATPTPQFAITPTSKDFGNVVSGQTATQVFTITNNGTADLSITAFALSGVNANEFSHNGTAQTIAPNGTYDVTVTFAPTSAGSKVASLDITDNDGNHNVALNGTGTTTCIVNIPDANFKAELVNNTTINTNGNTEIECSEAQAFNGTINVSNKSISDLTGIEAFTSITRLYCFNNSLTSLDVSQNTALISLLCYNNSLSSLDVSQNTSLTTLECYRNSISSLDVSQNTALTWLACHNNSLTTLDVSQNTALTRLHCDNNSLTTLDVSQNIALTYLYCHHNSLTSLDVSQNTALFWLLCNNNSLTSLDVSQNTALEELHCDENSLTSLDVSQNTALKKLYCHHNSFTSLNVANGNNTNLLQMRAQVNPNLTCIQHDTGFDPTTVSGWTKDTTANWSNDCDIPQFTITPISKDFGNVATGQNATQIFTITNIGTGDLSITSFTLGGANASEFSHNGTAQTIAPNGTYDITVTFTPTSAGSKVASLDITDNDGNHTVTLNGNGTAVPQFTITPTSKDFGNVVTGQTATQVFTITNTGTADLSITAFTLSGANSSEFSHNGTAQTIAPNGTYDVTVTFAPTSVGSKTTSLDIIDNDGNHTVALNGTGTVAPTPQFVITPTSKDFGNVQVNTNATQVFTITNNGTADLSITAFTLSGANSSEFSHNGTAQTIAPNGTYDVTVTFTPTSVGSKTANLDITDNTGNHTVALTGNATSDNKEPQTITWSGNSIIEIGCDSENSFVINATVSSGLPLVYEVLNTSIATIEGNIINFSQPGTTIVRISQPGNNSYSSAQPIIKTIIYKSSSLIQQHWDDTLFFDNSSEEYTSWQWYKNGNIISGATKQYYYENAPLSGNYHVVARLQNGTTIETCAFEVSSQIMRKNITVYPNPAKVNERVTIKTNYSASELNEAKLTVFSTIGTIVYEKNNLSNEFQIEAPSTSGVYIISLQLSNGNKSTTNLLVK